MNNSLPTPSGPEEIVYQGKLIEVVHQKMKVGDKEFTMEIARRAPGVRLIIISPDKKVLLAKEYRMEIKEWDTRLPGGKVFDSLKEYNEFLKTEKDIINQAKEAAKKETREEVGLEADEINFFATSHCGVSIIWDLHFFVVTKYHETSVGQTLELGENIELTWVDFDTAKQMCFDGTVQEGRSAAILLRYLSKIA